jgi:UDP-glucuronate decarboxylase
MNNEAGEPGPVNLGNPGEFTMMELAETILELTGSASVIEYRELPEDDPRQRQPDISKAKSVLGWEPTVALKEGLVNTIAYFDGVLGGKVFR